MLVAWVIVAMQRLFWL